MQLMHLLMLPLIIFTRTDWTRAVTEIVTWYKPPPPPPPPQLLALLTESSILYTDGHMDGQIGGFHYTPENINFVLRQHNNIIAKPPAVVPYDHHWKNGHRLGRNDRITTIKVKLPAYFWVKKKIRIKFSF